MKPKELMTQAKLAMQNAYAPYSHFQVGAALLGADGKVYTGCNVENAVYPAGICAERNAIFHAVAEGHHSFKRIVIAGKSQDFCVPCGVCRQVMREFASDLEIICLNAAGEEKTFTLSELLPHSFGPDHLNQKAP